jgi:hypothetical protein
MLGSLPAAGRQALAVTAPCVDVLLLADMAARLME